MLSPACVVPAMQAAEAGSSAAGVGHREAQQHDELRQAALRMRNEMPLKERTIHLQTFKYTFTGQQAVSFLQQQGMAGNVDVAADLCQRMLTQGLFKSSSHREVFVADGEVYRFSSSFPDGHKQKGRMPGSITSTGLYKEIAKIGKTAAQPFKNIQLSLNDTFNSLGNLSIPAAPKPGQLVSSLGGGGSRPHSSGNGTARGIGTMRRSQTGKLHHMYSDSTHGVPDPASSLATLASSLDVLQGSIQESTSLLRLDLQQHTALQEHLVGLLMAQQDSMRTTQLLIAVNAAAVLLLLGSSGSWSSLLLATALLALLVYSVGLEVVVGRARQAGLVQSEGGLLRRGSVSAVGRGLEQSLARVSLRTPAGTSAGVSEGGAMSGFTSAHDQAHDESDDVDDLEDSIPYIEDFEDWPDAPVMLCPDPAATQQEFEVECPGPCHALSVNGDPIPFESELFRGVVAIYIRHLPTTPPHLFKGKKRLGWVALQGTFKRPVSMDHLVYGMEFSHQLSNLPAPWFLENMLLPLARKISPSLRVGTLEDPFFFSPMITASQVVNVSLPGQSPHLMEAKEDTRLLLEELGGKAGDGLTVSSRRRYFQTASNRHMPFSTDHVWTFHLWQEYIDYASYMLNLGYSSYDLAQHLDGQPLQVMAKDESTGQQLISLHVWHANLVRCLTQRLPRRTRPSRISNASLDDLQGSRRSMQGTSQGGGVDPDTAAASGAVSPTAASKQPTPTPEQQLTPTKAQLQQQQQEGRLSAELDFTPQQQLQQRFEEQQAWEQQQQQRQRTPRGSASGGLQLPTFSSSGSAAQQQQQQVLAGSSLSEGQIQRPTAMHGLASQENSSGSVSDSDRARCSSPPSLQQLSSLRPARQSVSFTDRGGQGFSSLTGVQEHEQQQQLLSSKSLPPQQQQQQHRADVSGVRTPTIISTGDGSSGTAAAAAGDRTPSARTPSASGRSEGSFPGAAAAAAAGVTRAPSVTRDPSVTQAPSDTSRSGRLSSATSAATDRDLFSSSDGAAGWDSPLASRTPMSTPVGGVGGGAGGGGLYYTSSGMSGRGSGGGAGGVGGGAGAAGMLPRPQQQQAQQQLLQQTSSGRRKKKEKPDKEEQQRHQLHGLSVMGAL